MGACGAGDGFVIGCDHYILRRRHFERLANGMAYERDAAQRAYIFSGDSFASPPGGYEVEVFWHIHYRNIYIRKGERD